MDKLTVTGFDSAWGGTQRGAICDLTVDKQSGTVSIDAPPCAVNWVEAVERVTRYANSSHHIIAIDQGLIVPNPTGMRPVERSLAKALGSMHCSAYPSNRSNTSCFGDDAGIWRFLATLEQHSYHHEPLAIPKSESGRFFFECYPHPAIIGMMQLDMILKYKFRHRNEGAWQSLLSFLRSLPIEGIAEQIDAISTQNKANEDKIDSIVCAYVAYLWWRHGIERSTMIGNLTTGYIVTPHTPETLGKLSEEFGDDLNNALGNTPKTSQSTNIGYSSGSMQSSEQREASTLTSAAIPTEWSDVVELIATDTSNLSRTMRQGSRSIVTNDWMQYFSGQRLWVKFLDEDGEPEVAFVPHSASDIQKTLMADRQEQPGVWLLMVAGASKQTPLTFRVQYRYQHLNG